jgi:hypothetical protein
MLESERFYLPQLNMFHRHLSKARRNSLSLLMLSSLDTRLASLRFLGVPILIPLFRRCSRHLRILPLYYGHPPPYRLLVLLRSG